jgi:predicted AAA+ superfamily ATPase
MGKSALVKSVTGALQAAGLPLALVETTADQLASLPHLFALLGRIGPPLHPVHRRYGVRRRRCGPAPPALDARRRVGSTPANVRLYVTSNRRNIVERGRMTKTQRSTPAMSPTTGWRSPTASGSSWASNIPTSPPFSMVAAYAAHFGLEWEEADALAFAHQRGGRSGRVAWHYAVELAGRAGRSL